MSWLTCFRMLCFAAVPVAVMLSRSFQKGGLDSTRICDGKTSQWVLVVSAALYIPVAHCWSERCRNRVFHLLHHTGEQWRVVLEPMCYGRVVFVICHVHATATSRLSRDWFFLCIDHVCFVDFETYCSRFCSTVAELPSRVLWSDTIWSYLVAL